MFRLTILINLLPFMSGVIIYIRRRKQMKVRWVWIGVVVLSIAGVLVTSSDAALNPNTIVGVWKFDEGKGDIAKDSSENGNDGTLTINRSG